ASNRMDEAQIECSKLSGPRLVVLRAWAEDAPKTDGRPAKPNYYLCATQCNGETPCGQKMLPTGIVDQQIEAWVILHLRNKKKIREMLLKGTHTDNQQLAAQEKARIKELAIQIDAQKAKLLGFERQHMTVSAADIDKRVKEIYARALQYPKFGMEERRLC